MAVPEDVEGSATPSDPSDPRIRPPPPPVGPPLILLPTLNEEEGLRVTLEELRRVRGFAGPTAPTVLVVDGHSTDSTREVAARFGCHILTQVGRGKGAAVREGLDWAVANGFGSIAVLDADGTYPCDRLPAMLRLLERGADLVAGVRRPTHPSGSTTRNLVHRVGNGGLNLWAAVLSRGPILDVCTGFWGVRASVVPSLGLESTGFEVESELFVKAMRQRLRFAQMPVDYRPRVGEAKLHAVQDGARIWLSIARHSLRDRSRLRGSTPSAPHPAARFRAPPLTVALPTLLEAFPASSVLIVTGPSRYAEAIQVVRSVGENRPGVPVAVHLTASDPTGARWPEGDPAPEAPAAEPSVVVTLPEPDRRRRTSDTAFVHVPFVGRTLRVDVASNPDPSVAGDIARTESDGPTLRSLRAPGAFRIIGATLDISGVQTQLALLAANSAAARLRVSEVSGTVDERSRDRSREPSSFHSIPVPPGVSGSP